MKQQSILVLLGVLFLIGCSADGSKQNGMLQWEAERYHGKVKTATNAVYKAQKNDKGYEKGTLHQKYITNFSVIGNVMETVTENKDGLAIIKTVPQYKGTTLDKEVCYDKNGRELKIIETKSVNKDGLPTVKNEVNQFGNHYLTYKFEYGENELKKQMDVTNRTDTKYEVFTYDDLGRITKIEYIQNGKRNAYADFQYIDFDDSKNWTTRLEIFTANFTENESKMVRLHERTIVYY